MGFIAPNPTFNTSLNEGHRLQGLLQAQRVSSNPRLYANDLHDLLPETDAQDNSDLLALGWPTLGPSLQSQGTDPGLPIYLQVWVAEKQNLFDVAQVLRIVDGGDSFDNALR